jgi:hypothetical protein
MLTLILVLLIAALDPVVNDHEEKEIDTQRSSLVIYVGKAGLFSAAGHEHWVDAPIADGVIRMGDTPSVRLVVKAAKLTPRPDRALSAKELAEVQSNMQSKVLESSKYPEITFEALDVKSEGRIWKVNGKLTLHGVTRPVPAVVEWKDGAYAGIATIKQTDFGIHPIQFASGLVTVKNELRISFKLYVRGETAQFTPASQK